MTDWRNITDGALSVDAPIRSIDALALRDNPQAIAERSAGAPRVKPPSVEVLTGSGSWIVPVGVMRVRVRLIGGGGGGGGGTGPGFAGGGGGSGALVEFNLDVTPGDAIAYGCGAGGTAGPFGSGGGNGGATTFGTGGQSAGGGTGGAPGTGSAHGTGGASGSPSGGEINEKGFRGGTYPPNDGGHGHRNFGNGGAGSAPSGSPGNPGSAGAVVLEYCRPGGLFRKTPWFKRPSIKLVVGRFGIQSMFRPLPHCLHLLAWLMVRSSPVSSRSIQKMRFSPMGRSGLSILLSAAS